MPDDGWSQGTRKGLGGEEPDPYYIRRGEYTIAKCWRAGAWCYVAWRGRQRLGDCNSTDGAKQLVAAHEAEAEGRR